MIKHLIVEGVDGSGKTTLRDRLLERLTDFRPHPRASESIGGPVEHLDRWTQGNTMAMGIYPPSVYDRHPIISEPIYGPICRHLLPGMFNQPTWVHMMRNRVADNSLVVFCNPPLDVVAANVMRSRDRQMPGVVDNIRELHAEYNASMNGWPGLQIRYDYTRMSLNTLIHYIKGVTTNGN